MASNIIDFAQKIKLKKIKIGVVGLGYVGLPLAIEFAKKGIRVVGIEIDKDRLDHIKHKKSYISDVPSEDLRSVINKGNFAATGDFGALKKIDVVIICVPTPLKRKYHPNITFIKQAVKGIGENLLKGSLVILESTTYPGTTDEVILPMLEGKNLRHNRDFYLCFSPERIDPGNAAFPVHKIPKVIGGITPEATHLGSLVYKNIIENVVCVSSSRVAEMVKLLENTFRLVNIGLIDEMAMLAHKMKVDIWEVIDAAKTKPFGFMPFYPGPGVGGHCIPKDPLYLYWKAKHFGFRSRFIKLASDVINYMPEYVVDRVEHELKSKEVVFENAKILIIGVTYKKDIKDLRKSPSLDIIDILRKRGIHVAYFDPIIPYLRYNHTNLRSIELNKDALKSFDCVIIATDHSGVNYDSILREAKLIFDARNVYRGKKELKVIRL